MFARSRTSNDVLRYNLPLPGLSMLIRPNQIRQQIRTVSLLRGEKKGEPWMREDETGTRKIAGAKGQRRSS